MIKHHKSTWQIVAIFAVFSYITAVWIEKILWFSPGILIFSTNETDRHDITEILLKVALNTIPLTLTTFSFIRVK